MSTVRRWLLRPPTVSEGGGFAERLAPLRQVTLVEIDMRELRCHLDRYGPGYAAKTTRDQAS